MIRQLVCIGGQLLFATCIVCISISVINNRINCNGFECPPNTDTCSVAMTSNHNLTSIITELKCLSNGKELSKKTTSAPNPFNLIVNTYSQSSIGGGGGNGGFNSFQSQSTSSSGGYNDDQDLSSTYVQDGDDLGDHIRSNVNQQITQVRENLQRQFASGFWNNWKNFFDFQ